MASGKSVSFRTHLLANATDLISGVGLDCAYTAKLIASLASELAAYTEEGVPLSPTVFICNSITELLKRAGVGEHVVLGTKTPADGAAKKLLKAAGGLCGESWNIYVERSKNGASCNYGVFCGASDPSSLTLDEVLLAEAETGFPIVRVAQSATNKVEVRTNAGGSIEFRFNADADVHEFDPSGDLHGLADAIAADLGAQSESFARYIERLIAAALKRSHGALIAVVPSEAQSLPDILEDAVRLKPPLDLHERFRRHFDEGKTAASVSRLQTANELVTGFIGSDGITVFTATGQVLGYRAFIRPKAGVSPAAGGARTRAFEALAKHLGKELTAVLFRSQDGRIELRKAKPSND
jgi:hypothetical protein